MFPTSIGFVGGGRIARILLSGWHHGAVKLDQVVVSDPDTTAIARLTDGADSNAVIAGDNAAAARQAVVFLAVHPPVIPQVLTEITEHLHDDAVVISLAPKLTMDQLSGMMEGFRHLARVIPNAASMAGYGYNPIAWSEGLPESHRKLVKELLLPLGQCPEVPESTLEAYAVVTAMGPTYFWPQWSELVSIAETFGLPSQDAADAVRAMLQGAVAILFDSGLTRDEVSDLIPVKPLAELEPSLRETYRTKLTAVMEKIRPSI
jgi:pyrroline-5-carboxylate reductase